MNTNTKELIAIGASIAAHCQPCPKYHYAKAKELGISQEEIQEAIGVGHQVESGARKAMMDLETTLCRRRFQIGARLRRHALRQLFLLLRASSNLRFQLSGLILHPSTFW